MVLSDEAIADIVALKASGVSTAAIAREYGLHPASINKLVKRATQVSFD